MTAEQAAELETIRQKHPKGLLMPDEVVAAARKKSSTLHAAFTWDNSEAAEKWRLEEARNLIRAHVTYEPRVARQTRAYLSIPTDRDAGGGYRPTGEVVTRPDLVAQLVEEVQKNLLGLRARHSHLRVLDPLWDAIEAEVSKFAAARYPEQAAA